MIKVSILTKIKSTLTGKNKVLLDVLERFFYLKCILLLFSLFLNMLVSFVKHLSTSIQKLLEGYLELSMGRGI